jgi:hypothetical protein
MKYATEMGSGATIYVPSFIKIGSGIQKLTVGGIHRQFYFFKTESSEDGGDMLH